MILVSMDIPECKTELAPAKKPQALVLKRKSVDMINTGLFLHTAVAAAVKKVPVPVMSWNSPIRLKDI
jgi:hypothetical protein